MKIENIIVSNENIPNLSATILFDITEIIENVDILLKINEGEYLTIFTNQNNETITYDITNLQRGINNLTLKLVSPTEEYISNPFQVILKEEPNITDINLDYSDSSGKFILSFTLNGDSNFKYNIYMSLDNGEYTQVLSNQISGKKTIEKVSTMGSHTCILKVDDGYDEYTFDSFLFEITNHKPILTKILVTNINNNGTATINYSAKDVENPTLTHILTIDDNDTVITPSQTNNFFTYNISDLSVGIHNCKVKISDSIDTTISDVFTIEIFADSTDKKEILRQAKARYDNSYNQLKNIIISVISDKIFDYDMENDIINKAKDYYNEMYSNFNKIAQQSVDFIGTNKINVTKQDLTNEINDVGNAVDTLETTMNGVFKDGVLDENEKKILEENLNLVAKEKADVDRDYETLYNNEDLLDPAKTKLKTKYDEFTAAHTTLVTTIDDIVNKIGIIDNTDKSNIDTAFENWRIALGNYRNASLEAIDSIAKKKADDSADVIDKKWAEIILDPDTGIQAQVGNLKTTTEGYEERISTLEVTSESISSTVTSHGNTLSTHTSQITQLSNSITSVVTEDDVHSIIRQTPSDIQIGFNGISDYVTINSNGLTVLHGAIACDQLTTPTGHEPVINLFTRDGYQCQIDARKSDGGSFGTALRLKYDDYNYYYVIDNSIQFYQKGVGSFGFFYDTYGNASISTPHGTITFEDTVIGYRAPGENWSDRKIVSFNDHFHTSIEHNSTRVDCYSSYVDVTATSGLRVNGTTVSLEGHTHSGYASSSHTHNYASSSHSHSSISYGSTSVDCYSGSLYLDCSSIYLQGYTQVSGSLDPSSTGSYNLGYSSQRWNQVSALNIYADYCSGSDIEIKENIHYIKANNTSMFSIGDTDETLKKNTENNVNLGITNEDLYLFVKDELKLCEYNYTDEYIANGARGNLEGKLGFIAQDIADSKVGSLIVGDWEGQLTYNLNNYVSSLGGAIQYEIALRDTQIMDLEDRITELENRLNNM